MWKPVPIAAYGTTPAWAAWLAARHLGDAGAGPIIAVLPDEVAALEFEANVRFFGKLVDDPNALSPIAVLPPIDVSPYAELSPDRGNIVERLATIYRLSTPELCPRLVITCAEALIRKTIAPAELAARARTIAKGDTIDRDELAAFLVDAGWVRVPVVDEPGTFAVRGEVLDIYSPLSTHPVRVELFGDEVETLRTFDAESQRTLRPVDRVIVHPVRETIPTSAIGVRQKLRDYADELGHPSKATRKLIEQLEANEVFVGIEGLTPAFHDVMVAPGALFPANARYLIVDPDACRRAITDAWTDADHRHARRREALDLVFPPEAHLVATEEAGPFTAASRIELPTLEVHDDRIEHVRVDLDTLRTLKQELDHARTFDTENHVGPLLAAIKRWTADGYTITIGCDSQHRFDRLQGVLGQRGLSVDLVHGTPTQGFASLRDRVAYITSADIFGAKTHAPSTRQKRARDALLGGVADFGQLAPGDYLVHQRHGVGKYLGLSKLAIAFAPAPSDGPYAPPTREPYQIDTLKLEYDGGTLYLPVYRLGEVQRYVGAEGHHPKLDKLGGLTWEVTRKKVERHVQALAEELLQIYAQRAAIPGHAFPGADEAFAEFEATFPYEETPDQQAAIDAVLGDMEAPRAMDRLVCGDVGYGKTEVAIRAVFRCVQGGKQAAVLAPTTVLVEQHYRTMTERFRNLPVNVGKLSRFQSKAEQLATVKQLAEGQLDVVVGTHRLLSADVRWKALGLLVIDEEQRFGVSHKEKIKKSRTQIDVLTLTATPIPRTLHLAMANLRDLSIIATPPADRRAVRTFVSRVDDLVIKEAIQRELDRGGQIFFITPTIGTAGRGRAPDPRLPNDDRPDARRPPRKQRDDDRSIEDWSAYLQGLAPNARIAIGHGSLPPEQLEAVMLSFVKGEADILVATTIVESGLDIPRANTMFVARADAFGLAQLYQLRGRIGRSQNRAYCYLLVPEPEHITEEARRRLEALQRFTELGAGFQIASQDLEIRGGGELLGAKQSGSIAAVGFDQYVKMLEAAVAELNGKPIHSAIDPELQIETPGFIPDDYVPDPGQRLELYKRLSAVENDDDVARVMTEIADRYGPVPGDTVLLGELMGVKAIARDAGITSLEISGTRVVIFVPPAVPLAQNRMVGWKRLPDGRWSITPPPPGGAAGARQVLLALTGRATAST